MLFKVLFAALSSDTKVPIFVSIPSVLKLLTAAVSAGFSTLSPCSTWVSILAGSDICPVAPAVPSCLDAIKADPAPRSPPNAAPIAVPIPGAISEPIVAPVNAPPPAA